MNVKSISLGMIVLGALVGLGLIVFVIWQVVDVPWENSDTPAARPNPTRQLSRCEVLQQQLADARTERAAAVLHRQGQDLGCWR